ncbi:MAG TPA: outer membrane protein assembly factor BamD [Candidatus Marinimicrobia bacterium]|jgi:outer membrane protein assembly factor BamD|nr:outer membrane protein assembly factor BamD [Candidatus Neomarinimicrobiota bacterium]
MKKRYFIILFTSLIITSCSSTKPEEVDLQKQFDRATNYLEKKRYMRAQEEFNSVAIRGLHTDLGDDAQFFLGESYFLNKEYILAIAEYDRLIRRMGFSEYVQKARWRICQCYVEQSPKYYHEQSSTERALSKLQEFLDDYPNTEFHEEALTTITDMRNKLATKLYESGRLYVKMEEYASAIITYEDLLANYYDTELVDDAHLQIVKCHALAGEIEKAVDYLANNRKQFSNDDQLAEAEKFIKQNDKN